MLRAALKARRDTAVQHLRRDWPEVQLTLVPRGGFYLSVRLPPGAEDVAFAKRAARAGVQVAAGSGSFAAEPNGSFVHLSSAGATPDVIADAVQRLSQVP